MIVKIIILIFCFCSLHAATIQLFFKNQYAGLRHDGEILTEELQRLGHTVTHVNSLIAIPQKADFNIFLEHIWPACFVFAPRNYFIPNPEWTYNVPSILEKCDLILCKTRHAEEIFSRMNFNTYYLNFISRDQYDPEIVKDFTHPFFSIGTSGYKGHSFVLNVWKKRPDFPVLTFLTTELSWAVTNVDCRTGYVPDEEHKKLQNAHGLHLCPSQAEGFGHYIIEAMSTGAVVLTTDAPPMNEYVDDPRLKVRTLAVQECRLGSIFEIDEEDLERKIEQLLSMAPEEYNAIGRRNRQFFLDKRADFRARLKTLFGECL